MSAIRNNSAAAPGRSAPEQPTSDTARVASAGQIGRHKAAPTRRDRLRGCIKGVIVNAACWGFPASWAQWLIQRGGLRDA